MPENDPGRDLRARSVKLISYPLDSRERCREYVLEDRVLERVDVMLGKVDEDAELKVLKFAA
jgi:hypothetical protein